MRATIVIHNHNRAEPLRRCLKSIVKQSYRPLEVVLLDSGSTDGSLDIIDHYVTEMHAVEIETTVRSDPGDGVAASRNLGVALATGHVIFMIDNDAAFESAGAVHSAMARLSKYPHVGLVSFRILLGDSDQTDPLTWVFRREPREWAERSFKTFSFAGGGFCIRRQVFREAGGFWEALRYAREEEELALGVLDRGYEIWYAPDVVVRHYPHHDGRMNLAHRREVELRNGALVFYRRLPRPVAVAGIVGRSASIALRTRREGGSVTALGGCLSDARRQWQTDSLTRRPVHFKTLFRYVLLHDARRQ